MQDTEKKISEIIEEVFPIEKMKEQKRIRRNFLQNKKRNQREEEEYKVLENEDSLMELVEYNYSKNYLVDLTKRKKDEHIILVMGINPGGGRIIPENRNIEINQKLLCINNENVKKGSYKEKLIKILSEKGIIFQNYHNKNYNLFEGIEGKLFWTLKTKEEWKMILEKNIKDIEEKKELLKTFENIYGEEVDKSGPYIVFGDLFWYADGTQSNIEAVIKDFNGINTKVKELMDIYIEYYNPKIIVITNAYASHLVEEAIPKENYYKPSEVDVIYYQINNKKIPIVFSGMVSGQRTMDTYSYIRLKNRIENLYKGGK